MGLGLGAQRDPVAEAELGAARRACHYGLFTAAAAAATLVDLARAAARVRAAREVGEVF